jgi:hypothetical protein
MINLSKKQIIDYIKTLNYDDDHKEKILNNFDINFFRKYCNDEEVFCIKTLSNEDFIMGGFSWRGSIEGHLYWGDYYHILLGN